MLTSRRYLPSISLLSAFETAARVESFSQAARELDLTQSAISRQIRALEEQIGVELFARNRQKVKLTDAGEVYAQEVRRALTIIASASINMRSNAGGGTLDLAVLPTFGARWLAPRLADFFSANPGVTVNFTTRLRPFDFGTDKLDAAIHFGQPDWANTEAVFLMGETIVPACSPEFKQQHRFSEPGHLLNVPLIHLSSRRGAWANWFDAHGIDGEINTGMNFDEFAAASQAARHGLGVALLPEFLIRQELADGNLVAAFNSPLKGKEAYYLVWPSVRSKYPPLVAFRDWIKNAAGEGV